MGSNAGQLRIEVVDPDAVAASGDTSRAAPAVTPQTPAAPATPAQAEQPRTETENEVFNTMQGAGQGLRNGIGAVGDAGAAGVGAVREGVNDLGASIRQHGFFRGIWNYFSGLGRDTAEGTGNFFTRLFSGTNHGGWIGGLLGVGGAWMASTMMGGGMLGNIAMLCLIPAGFIVGRALGNDHINPMLSNMFGGNRERGERGRDGQERSEARGTQHERANGAERSETNVQTGPQASSTLFVPPLNNPNAQAPAAPGIPADAFAGPAALAFVASGVSYSPSGTFALGGDQGLAAHASDATMAARNAGVVQTAPGTPAGNGVSRAAVTGDPTALFF